MKAEINSRRTEIRTIQNSTSKEHKLDSAITSNQVLQEILPRKMSWRWNKLATIDIANNHIPYPHNFELLTPRIPSRNKLGIQAYIREGTDSRLPPMRSEPDPRWSTYIYQASQYMEMSSICRGRAQRCISGLLSLKDRSKAEVAGCNEVGWPTKINIILFCGKKKWV